MNEKNYRFAAVWHLYRDGFRNMTWGKPVWGLRILKAIILFAVLRVFFFKPAMAGMSDRQKSEQVGRHLTNPSNANNGQTINIDNLKL